MKKDDDGAVTLLLPEEDDGGTTSSLSPSNAAVASDPSNVAVGEQGPDAGPILLVARRRRSSVNLRTSSNITNHVSFLIFTFLSKYYRLISPHITLPFSSCRNCVLDLRDRKRTLVPCVRRTCVSNHTRMRRTGIRLLPCQRADDWVLDNAIALSQMLPSLMQLLQPIFHFISQPPTNISHLKRDVLEHHVNLGGDWCNGEHRCHALPPIHISDTFLCLVPSDS
jgi:hypothetical protein